MDICSKRFSIKRDPNTGCVYIRDRNAPYHPHTIDESDVPSAGELAAMTESQFDKRMSALAYG